MAGVADGVKPNFALGGFNAGAPFLSTSVDGSFTLHWEQATSETGARSRWLARAPDESQAQARDFFIAVDDLSGYLVGVMRPRQSGDCRVIAATPLGEAIHLADAVISIKDQIAGWLMAPHEAATRTLVHNWRRQRFWIIARANTPLAIGAFFVGGLVGMIVALGAVWVGLAGWPMLIAALLVGAGAGFILKHIAYRPPKPGAAQALAGSWVRFVLVTIAAIVGAGLGSAGVLTFLFWGS